MQEAVRGGPTVDTIVQHSAHQYTGIDASARTNSTSGFGLAATLIDGCQQGRHRFSRATLCLDVLHWIEELVLAHAGLDPGLADNRLSLRDTADELHRPLDVNSVDDSAHVHIRDKVAAEACHFGRNKFGPKALINGRQRAATKNGTLGAASTGRYRAQKSREVSVRIVSKRPHTLEPTLVFQADLIGRLARSRHHDPLVALLLASDLAPGLGRWAGLDVNRAR